MVMKELWEETGSDRGCQFDMEARSRMTLMSAISDRKEECTLGF